MRHLSILALLFAATACEEVPAGGGAERAQMPGDGVTGPVVRGAEVALADAPFTVEELGNFEEPWAAAFMPGTPLLFITSKRGGIVFKDVVSGRLGSVESGLPDVAYGGQGGLGDIAFAPGFEVENPGRLYLSWVESGPDGTRGAVVGRGMLLCEEADSCRLEGLEVIWRQDKTGGAGHYSHRIHFSPDGRYLFVTSGDRQKQDPAQDLSNNLGSVLRLTPDGKPAPGNPFEDRGGSAAQVWSYGHRNLLGIDVDGAGRLWVSEMGPRHGDELNLIEAGGNYGWPEASYGDNYNGSPIPDHVAGDGYVGPAATWVPATSPASLLIYGGAMFPEWQGDAIVPGLSGKELNVVSLENGRATAMTSYDFGIRLREVVEGTDGAIYLLEDQGSRGGDGTLMRLVPKP